MVSAPAQKRAASLIFEPLSITSRDAKFPPDAESLRLVHRGPGVEDWMLLTTSPIGSGQD
jgi:hypothetical protein